MVGGKAFWSLLWKSSKALCSPRGGEAWQDPGVMGLSVCFAALSYAKNDTQGLSLHLCGAGFSPGVSSFTTLEQKGDNFFLILLHCPCCSSKEHKRPLQGTASPTTNNNKKCGKLEGFKDATTTCHPPFDSTRGKRVKNPSKPWSSGGFVPQRRQIINSRKT